MQLLAPLALALAAAAAAAPADSPLGDPQQLPWLRYCQDAGFGGWCQARNPAPMRCISLAGMFDDAITSVEVHGYCIFWEHANCGGCARPPPHPARPRS